MKKGVVLNSPGHPHPYGRRATLAEVSFVYQLFLLVYFSFIQEICTIGKRKLVFEIEAHSAILNPGSLFVREDLFTMLEPRHYGADGKKTWHGLALYLHKKTFKLQH